MNEKNWVYAEDLRPVRSLTGYARNIYLRSLRTALVEHESARMVLLAVSECMSAVHDANFDKTIFELPSVRQGSHSFTGVEAQERRCHALIFAILR